LEQEEFTARRYLVYVVPVSIAPETTGLIGPLAPDAILARALVEGETGAALRAWRRFNPLVHRTLRRMLGPGADLQDLAQEVFLRFFCKIQNLRKPESLRAFVLTIAVRRAQEELKRRRVRRSLAPILTELTLRSSTTEVDLEAREAIAHLLGTLERLKAADLHIYWLRKIAGLDHAEIGLTIGRSMSTVRRRFERLTRRVTSLMRADPVLSAYLARGEAAARVRPVRAG
jgi:RNA polymerase sigma-70 factor, ECF subfamily